MSGNIFKDANGNTLTSRIDLKQILPTIQWLENLTSLPLACNTLGSVGKKMSSGDIDIAVDSTKCTKEYLVSKLSAWAISNSLTPQQFVKKSGISVHFKTPIAGNLTNGFVQTDFMFGDDIEFMKFSLFSSGDKSKFTGGERNLLMSSIAKSVQHGITKYSWQKGLITRSSNELISKDPQYIATWLLNGNYSKEDLNSVETIICAIKHNNTRVKQLTQLMSVLLLQNGKKSSEINADLKESKRIEAALSLL